MKRILILLIISLLVLIPASLVYKKITLPSKLRLELPDTKNLVADSLTNIVVKIDENEIYYLNSIQTDFALLFNKIDSLGKLGFNDSVLIVDPDSTVSSIIITRLMDLARKAKKEIVLKTNQMNKNSN